MLDYDAGKNELDFLQHPKTSIQNQESSIQKPGDQQCLINFYVIFVGQKYLKTQNSVLGVVQFLLMM
jgi:hypothetical protein